MLGVSVALANTPSIAINLNQSTCGILIQARNNCSLYNQNVSPRLCLSLFLLLSLKPSEIDSSQLLPVVRNPPASDLMSNYPLVARDKFFRSRINAL